MRKKIHLLVLMLILSSNFPLSWASSKHIKIKKTARNSFYLAVDNKPFLIKAVSYNPVPIGQGYNHDFFRDENKPWQIDAVLMKKMGINAVRIYSAESDLKKVKEFINYLYQHGIYTLVSDWLGLWNTPAVNYADPACQKKIKNRLLKIVRELRNEKGVLLWILGNENNYTFSGEIVPWSSPEIEALANPAEQVTKRAEIYYTFINDLAKAIKKVDRQHPVALGNGETHNLDIAAQHCTDIDLVAAIMYRGKTFGTLFDTVQRLFNKPLILSEFGCDAYNVVTDQEDQDAQAKFLKYQWQDIWRNTAFGAKKGKSAICLGGVLFEWSDEWWKHAQWDQTDWSKHNPEGGWYHGSYYYDNKIKGLNNMNEEWFGIISLSEELENGINKRIPRKAYYELKEYFESLKIEIPN